MAAIIDYDTVLAAMLRLGLHCQYYNSGAFNFTQGMAAEFVGWIGPPDASIRPAALAQTHPVAPPYESNLSGLACHAWRRRMPGPMWLMPKSQWAYELDFGSKDWLPDALSDAGVDAASLHGQTRSPAVEFSLDEAPRAQRLIERLLSHLRGSDFALAFPTHPVACTLHHHKQIWWISTDAALIRQLTQMASPMKA